MCSFLYLLSFKRTVCILISEVKQPILTILLTWKLCRTFLNSEIEDFSSSNQEWKNGCKEVS